MTAALTPAITFVNSMLAFRNGTGEVGGVSGSLFGRMASTESDCCRCSSAKNHARVEGASQSTTLDAVRALHNPSKQFHRRQSCRVLLRFGCGVNILVSAEVRNNALSRGINIRLRVQVYRMNNFRSTSGRWCLTVRCQMRKKAGAFGGQFLCSGWCYCT